jgi:3-phosphoinositide dependent protein kinase-1
MESYLASYNGKVRYQNFSNKCGSLGRLSPELTKFLSAEIINILQYIHGKGICHRDLKPSNLLIDDNYHLKLVDFGCSKFEEKKKFNRIRPSICIEMDQQQAEREMQKTLEERLNNLEAAQQTKSTLVGTEDYIAPEVVQQKESGAAADLWSLGVIIYMMISGRTPFKGANQMQTFDKIVNEKLTFPDNNPNFTDEAKDLLMRLLEKDPEERLGAGPYGSENDYEALKAHPYFAGTDFDKVFLMITPYDFKKFQRSTLRQKILEQKKQDEGEEDLLTSTNDDD